MAQEAPDLVSGYSKLSNEVRDRVLELADFATILTMSAVNRSLRAILLDRMFDRIMISGTPAMVSQDLRDYGLAVGRWKRSFGSWCRNPLQPTSMRIAVGRDMGGDQPEAATALESAVMDNLRVAVNNLEKIGTFVIELKNGTHAVLKTTINDSRPLSPEFRREAEIYRFKYHGHIPITSILGSSTWQSTRLPMTTALEISREIHVDASFNQILGHQQLIELWLRTQLLRNPRVRYLGFGIADSPAVSLNRLQRLAYAIRSVCTTYRIALNSIGLLEMSERDRPTDTGYVNHHLGVSIWSMTRRLSSSLTAVTAESTPPE